ncbi:protein kinase RIM15 KNAG_0E03200 [Huiozyma naganishii CBS 8797]|uniref:non-specific serine/threonine protein kinase n=1 Tax=Huiozyma naganishii (strain ATCC MYA-139 / BCRC 22969 / CBS 8797 / KCTC 17520 / NBRC 10181 / NCYC 3082 / Yp74L-3) TaxID=1071383 RepID=J7S6U4_HUIN7|nr:hypothetical protein KNAG_0E03200 [Kazachstania naganishii CBS 8797]CCK70579.1 hypothetical protein KNAG_0E03200 [Kazachstania naganishii CBS 8797]
MSGDDDREYEDYLRLATEQNPSMIMELDLEGRIKYISKQWEDIVQLPVPTGSISSVIDGTEEDKMVFNRAMEMMLQNDNISYTVTFTLASGEVLEACGIMISGDEKQETHSMWILKPYNEMPHDIVGLPETLLQKLGFGATIFHEYLKQLEAQGITDEAELPCPRLELCRVCECFVPDWWLETHSQTCVMEHRVESVIQLLHDNLIDQMNLISQQPTEYKNLPLVTKSDSYLDNILDSLKNLCQFAININTSELFSKYQKFHNNKTESLLDMFNDQGRSEEQDNASQCFFEFSPNTKTHIREIQLWENPLQLDSQDHDPDNGGGLTLLVTDTIQLAREKVEAVVRLDNAMTYSLKIRNEINNEVMSMIREQLEFNRMQIPKLESPQPSAKPLFANSYLQNDVMPHRSDNDSNGSRLSNMSTKDPTSSSGTYTPTDITAPQPREECPSGSITPGTEVAYPKGTKSAQHTTLLSGDKYKPLPTVSTVATSLLPKARTTISLTPRRGSPLLMQRTSSANPSITDKSPLNSPFVNSREYLTPEQFPAGVSSPNQPLSPLLLATNQFKTPAPTIKDYDILKPISKGAYGSVYLAKRKLTGEYFAIKVLRKSDMIAKNQVTNVKSERAIMMVQSDKPYVARLYATFQNKNNLFLVMEYLAGGDLAALLKMMGYLPDKWVKQYITEIIIGVDDMHRDGIIHHDLKPDNLLIDSSGHVKLTDFGLSRAGLIKRHKMLPRKKNSLTLTQDNSPSSSTPNSNQSFRIRRAAKSRNPSDSSETSKPLDFVGKFNSEVQALKRTESELSFSMIDVSRSSTPPPPMTGMRTSTSSANGSFSSTTGGGGGKGGGSSSSAATATTAVTPTLPLTNDVSTPVQVAPTTGIEYHSLESSTAPPSDLALFHPNDTKQNKKFFGTPDYLAPETIEGTGEDPSCDWWSVGCIFFELLLGYPPFHASTPERVFQKILSCDVQWPEFSSLEEEREVITPEAKDLIIKLLELDPKKRLGSNGAIEIMKHPYFNGVDWDNVYDSEASFVPSIENMEDTDYFDPRGAVLEDFGGDDNDEDVGNSSVKMNRSRVDSNLDVPEIQTSPGYVPLLGSPGGDNSGQNKSSGLALTTSADIAGLSNKALNKLSIASVLESVPHDAAGSRSSAKSISLAIPPHMRERRGSKLSDSQTEFGSFYFRNLSALDKANKDAINRLKSKHMNEAGQHRRSSSSSQAGSSSENSLSKARPGRISLNGSPAINSITRSIAKSDTSSVRSFSPDRSMSLERSITSRKGSNASMLDSIVTANPLTASITNASTPIGVNPSFYYSDSESPIVNKFKSPLSPSHAVQSSVARSGLILKPAPVADKRRSSSETNSENSDRLQAISRVNSLRYRRRSQRKSSGMSDNANIGYHMDILLCEPIPIHLYRAVKDLETLGCSVVSVGAADELVSRATGSVKFDIIISAYRLSKLGALDICKLLRKTNGINSNTPFIVVTNYYQEALSFNVFDDVLEKPVVFDDLRRVISKYALKKSQEEEDTIFSDADDFHIPQ